MEKTDNSYIAIDLETTGLNPKTERIIEIGAARVEDGIVVQTYSTFVNPERELDARIRELTGICDDDLKDAPVLDTVLPELLAFCGELPLLGHHVIFDFSFLKRAAVNRKYTFEHAGLENLPPFYASGGKKESGSRVPVFCGGFGREPSGAFGCDGGAPSVSGA